MTDRELSEQTPIQGVSREPDTQVFVERIDHVADMLKAAFAGPPWHEDLSTEEALERVKQHAMKPGFDAFVITDDEERVIAGLWYDTPSIDELVVERGEDLGAFAHAAQQEADVQTIIWARESVVHPDAQGQGYATALRRDFLKHVAHRAPGPSLVLTRMRDDNHGIIAVASKFGYQRTGIRMPSSQNPDVHHEYWFKVVDDVA